MDRLKNFIVAMLRASERFFKTDMVYLAKGGFWITVGRGVGMLSGLLLTLVLANAVSKETLGTYKFVQSLAGVITAFSLTGMGLAVTRAVAKGEEGAARAGFRAHLKWSFLMTLIAAGAAAYYFLQHNAALAWSLVAVGLALPFSQSGALYAAYLEGKKDFRRETLYGIFGVALPPLATALAAFFSDSALALIAAYFSASALAAMALYALVMKKHGPKEGGGSAETVRYGKHLSFMNVLGGISFQMDKILVFHFLGAAELALYAIALAPPQQIRYFNKTLATLALPKLAAADAAALKQTLYRKAALVFAGALALALAYILAAPFIFKLFFPAYMESVAYSQGYALMILFFPAMLFQQALTARMRYKHLYVIQTAGPLFKVALFFILLPLFGVWGVIMSTLATEILRFAFVLWAFAKLPGGGEAPADFSDERSSRPRDALLEREEAV